MRFFPELSARLYKSETKIESQTTIGQGSTINAGGNINITATEGDLTIKGSQVQAEDILLKAKENVNLQASQNQNQTKEDTKSSSASIGVNIGASGITGININASKAEGQIKENGTTYNQTEITAGNKLTIESGKDTNIIGSTAAGNKVEANIGGNLNIESLQDKQTYDEKNSSAGIGINTDLLNKGKTSITGGINKGKIESDYESVTQQAGIYAGQEGFDINVGGNTDLKGAVIASEAEASKNKLSTETLTYEDIQNKAEYSASSSGINVNTDKDAKLNEKGITPNIGITAEDEASSTTKSAIAEGTIEVRGEKDKDLSGLSRDTENALNKLEQIFDKKTVQEKQEMAQLFGEIAFEEVHKLANKMGWDDGSKEKIILHGLVGGIMAELGGGKFGDGLTSAAVNEAIIKAIGDLPVEYQQLASALVGTAVAKITGGDANTGASVAASATKNNLQYQDIILHPQQVEESLNMEREDKFEELNADYNVWKDLYEQGEISPEAYEYIKESYDNQYNIIFKETDFSYWPTAETAGEFILGFGGIPGMVLGDLAFNPNVAEAGSLGKKEVTELMSNPDFVNKFLQYSTRPLQYVYTLVDENGNVKYVGRTDNPDRRRLEHKNSIDKGGLDFKLITKESVSFAEGRGLEQYFYEKYGGKALLNKIRPVNTDKAWGKILLELGKKALNKI